MTTAYLHLTSHLRRLILLFWFLQLTLPLYFSILSQLSQSKKKGEKKNGRYINTFDSSRSLRILRASYSWVIPKKKQNKQDKPRKEKKIFEISITIDWKCCLFYTRYCCCCRFEFLLPRISTRTLRRYLKHVHRVFPLFQRPLQEIFVFVLFIRSLRSLLWPDLAIKETSTKWK